MFIVLYIKMSSAYIYAHTHTYTHGSFHYILPILQICGRGFFIHQTPRAALQRYAVIRKLMKMVRAYAVHIQYAVIVFINKSIGAFYIAPCGRWP